MTEDEAYQQSADRPPIRIGSTERIVGRSAGERQLGPYVQLDLDAVRFLDGLVGRDVSAAREFLAEMMAALEADTRPEQRG